MSRKSMRSTKSTGSHGRRGWPSTALAFHCLDLPLPISSGAAGIRIKTGRPRGGYVRCGPAFHRPFIAFHRPFTAFHCPFTAFHCPCIAFSLSFHRPFLTAFHCPSVSFPHRLSLTVHWLLFFNPPAAFSLPRGGHARDISYTNISIIGGLAAAVMIDGYYGDGNTHAVATAAPPFLPLCFHCVPAPPKLSHESKNASSLSPPLPLRCLPFLKQRAFLQEGHPTVAPQVRPDIPIPGTHATATTS